VTAGLTALLIGVAGGIGAALRLALDGVIRDRVRSSYPVGITVINLTGSLLLGLLTGLTGHHLESHRWALVVGTGLLGGYTTFSTASVETVRLLEDRRYLAAGLNGLGMLVGAVAAAALGLAAGLALRS